VAPGEAYSEPFFRRLRLRPRFETCPKAKGERDEDPLVLTGGCGQKTHGWREFTATATIGNGSFFHWQFFPSFVAISEIALVFFQITRRLFFSRAG
jgi:hypothetical protein